MDVIRTYGNYIKKYADNHPKVSLKMIEIGLHLELFRTKHFADKKVPLAYQELNSLAVGSVLHSLEHPETTAWTNLFTPVEILQCFGFNCLSMEALSSFISGFTCEDYFINRAEASGIAPTLCSYHKDFIGAVVSNVLPDAAFAVTTSSVCDANFNTFRYINKIHPIPTYMIDIPAEYNEDTVCYVVEQLQELISILEKQTGKRFDMDELSQVLERENLSKKYYEEYFQYKADKYYPSTLTLQMYELFATHLSIGTPEALHVFEHLRDEIKTAPDFHGKRIYWVHLLPFYQETLKEYFNLSEAYQLQGFEMNTDYMEELDIQHPLEALAKKMIKNLYNGPFDQKIETVIRNAKALNADGIINFCHWGCKQSSGGVMLLKDAVQKAGIPMLIIDGDGIDRKNSHNGQIKTRLEAFLEVLENHNLETSQYKSEQTRI